MQRIIRNFWFLSRLLLRYTLVWIADAVSIGVTALAVPGVYFLRDAPFWYLHPFIVALLFGLLNALVRPVLIILLLPITFITLGLATLVLNAALFYVAHVILESFVIINFGAAVIGVLVLTIVNTLLGGLIPFRDDYSFYATLINKFGTMTRPREADLHDRGVVLLQIDGLSYRALKHAIRSGRTPYLGALVKQRRYSLRRWFSGLPSQTPAVQTCMFYGSSYDIPGFRWYDRATGRIVQASNATDMSDIDERFHREGTSILENGSCINSLVHGNAKKRMLVVSSMSDREISKHRDEIEDLAIFSLHPYLYTRTIMLMIWDFVVDRIEAWFEVLRRKQPRVFRSAKFSIHRAVGNACFRELTTFFVREDIVRGMPIIYANYLGYDMVAHYAGPTSGDAMRTLTAVDRHIKRIARTIRKQANKHYDLLIISDHGQSDCIAFEKLYEQPLEKVIEEHLENRDVDTPGDTGELGYFSVLLRDLRRVEEAYGGRVAIRGSRRTLERLRARLEDREAFDPTAEVIVCPSGSLAHVYFTDNKERLTTEELISSFGELLRFLVSHPGIGFVITRNAVGEHLMMGPRGMRNLTTGALNAVDPLITYASGQRADQYATALANLSNYPSAGDLILNGAMLDSGRVISFEKQVGTHGGLGGDETDPFLLYPGRFRRKDDRVATPVDMHEFLKGLLR